MTRCCEREGARAIQGHDREKGRPLCPLRSSCRRRLKADLQDSNQLSDQKQQKQHNNSFNMAVFIVAGKCAQLPLSTLHIKHRRETDDLVPDQKYRKITLLLCCLEEVHSSQLRPSQRTRNTNLSF
jgi:hypothetical protein